MLYTPTTTLPELTDQSVHHYTSDPMVALIGEYRCFEVDTKQGDM